jgi:hypothetical protein
MIVVPGAKYSATEAASWLVVKAKTDASKKPMNRIRIAHWNSSLIWL